MTLKMAQTYQLFPRKPCSTAQYKDPESWTAKYKLSHFNFSPSMEHVTLVLNENKYRFTLSDLQCDACTIGCIETGFKCTVTLIELLWKFQFLDIVWQISIVIFWVLFLCSCSTPSRHMDFSISVMNISRQHCSWMKSRQISGWISPSSRLQGKRRRRKR